jgi:hypothetical protein
MQLLDDFFCHIMQSKCIGFMHHQLQQTPTAIYIPNKLRCCQQSLAYNIHVQLFNVSRVFSVVLQFWRFLLLF